MIFVPYGTPVRSGRHNWSLDLPDSAGEQPRRGIVASRPEHGGSRAHGSSVAGGTYATSGSMLGHRARCFWSALKPCRGQLVVEPLALGKPPFSARCGRGLRVKGGCGRQAGGAAGVPPASEMTPPFRDLRSCKSCRRSGWSLPRSLQVRAAIVANVAFRPAALSAYGALDIALPTSALTADAGEL